jgi:hypothetical protein
MPCRTAGLRDELGCLRVAGQLQRWRASGPAVMLTAMQGAFATAASGIDGVIEAGSAFGHEQGWWVNGKEIAHFDADGSLDIRLTKAIIRQRRPSLEADPDVELRRTGSDWISVRLTTANLAAVLAVFEDAASAHRAPAGSTTALAPTGAALERRRRFH